MTAQDIFMFIDETGLDKESKILAIACIVTSERDFLKSRLEELKRNLLKDKRFKDIPSIKNLESKGFHYCEDHQDIKSKVIDLIALLPFDAYICYKHKKDDFCPSNDFAWYDELFGKLMHDRLLKHKKCIIRVCFEQHGKSSTVRTEELNSILERLIYNIGLKYAVNFPTSPTIYSAGKEESCLALADYVAAIFKDYESIIRAQETEKRNISTSWQARHFFMLRPKIRVIHNYETGEFFTRHNPFP
jgi:hypothetical protein